VRAYRARLRGRRLLVILDNATNASQILPAIPDEPGCAAIVTSRRPIAGPDGSVHMHVDSLSTKESVSLLARIAGPRKADGEPEAAAELAALCANNPLALRTIATRAASRPHWALGAWVELLTAPDRGRAELADVLVSLRVSVDQLARGGTEAEQAGGQPPARRRTRTDRLARLTGGHKPLSHKRSRSSPTRSCSTAPPRDPAHYGLAALLGSPATPG